MTRPSTRARSQYLAECEAGRVPRPHTEADARAYFVEQQQTRLRGEELNFAFVESANDDAVLEGCSLYYVDVEQSRAAVGYWLAPEARGGWCRDPRRPATRSMSILRVGPGPSRADMRPRQ